MYSARFIDHRRPAQRQSGPSFVIAPASSYSHEAEPASVSGTSVTGALVEVRRSDGTTTTTFNAQVVGGVWTVDFGANLTFGSNQLTATQTLNGRTSEVTSVVFTAARRRA